MDISIKYDGTEPLVWSVVDISLPHPRKCTRHSTSDEAVAAMKHISTPHWVVIWDRCWLTVTDRYDTWRFAEERSIVLGYYRPETLPGLISAYARMLTCKSR